MTSPEHFTGYAVSSMQLCSPHNELTTSSPFRHDVFNLKAHTYTPRPFTEKDVDVRILASGICGRLVPVSSTVCRHIRKLIIRFIIPQRCAYFAIRLESVKVSSYRWSRGGFFSRRHLGLPLSVSHIILDCRRSRKGWLKVWPSTR
jgi:hypothetical protein